jgi:hypothetical protein
MLNFKQKNLHVNEYIYEVYSWWNLVIKQQFSNHIMLLYVQFVGKVNRTLSCDLNNTPFQDEITNKIILIIQLT